MIILITGGSGSGKSALAESLVPRLAAGRRIYLATMAASGGESLQRIGRHRRQRASLGMETAERSADLDGLEVPEGALVLLEDVPNWLAGEMFGGGDAARMLPALRRLAGRCRHLILVTGDVFRDGGRYDAETERYLETLAVINREAAALADAVCEVVCGIPVMLKGKLP